MKEFKGKKILIVGGAGFVGSNLANKLLKNSDCKQLIIVDNLISSEVENIPIDERVKFLQGSIADDALLQQLDEGLDYVFHLSCYHGNQSSIFDPLKDHENNTITSLKLFNHLERFSNLKKVVYAAAGCAVAEKTYDDAEETLEDAPISLFHDSPYSISKLIGEFYGNYFFLKNNFPFVKARFQNVYGPREILGAGRWRGTPHTVWRNVTPTFIWKALHDEELPLDNGGETSRDFIYVEDLVSGLIHCAISGTPGEAYNLASGVETKILELAEKIIKISNSKSHLKIMPARNWDRSGRRFGSTKKSKKELGFSAKVALHEGLESTILWTKDNYELIKKNILKHEISVPDVKKYHS